MKTMGEKVLSACLASALAFVWVGLALAWGAAALQWGRTAGTTWTGWEVAGTFVALAWTTTCVAVLGCAGRSWSDHIYILVASGMVLAVGLGWAWGTHGMEKWPMDSGLCRWFLERLADGGFSSSNMDILQKKTDCVLWVGRVLPLYPLRQAVGENAFGLAVQIAQAIAGTLEIWMAWRLVKLLFNGLAARWTVAGLVSMPAFGMQAIGWNHQVWGSFYFLAGIWVLVEWLHGGGTRLCRWGLAILALGIMSTMWLEGYVGKLYMAVAFLLLAWEWLRYTERRTLIAGALMWVLLVSGGIAWGMMDHLQHQFATSKTRAQLGGQLVFGARGWNMQAWGEYSDVMDHLDALTPPNWKNHLCGKYIAGQCAYHGRTLVVKLFPAKLAKFMLAGYASLAEEVLWANGAERTGRVARGMRVGWFVLLYSPLMLWGLWRLSRCVGAGDSRVAWLVFPVAMFGAAVMVAGETSPRYAMPVQALLIAAGACGWVQGRQRQRDGGSVLRYPFATGLVVLLLGYGVFAGGLLGARGFWRRYALEDMRKTVLEGGHPSPDAFQAPFEAVFPEGVGTAIWAGKGGNATVYLRGKSWRERGPAMVSTREGEWRDVELPVRLEVVWEEAGERRLSVRRLGAEGELWLGYAEVGAGAGR